MSNGIDYSGVFRVTIKRATKLFPDEATLDHFRGLLDQELSDSPYTIESLMIIDKNCVIMINDSFGSIETPEDEVREAVNTFLIDIDPDDRPSISIVTKRLKSETPRHRALPDHLSAKNTLSPLFFLVTTNSIEGISPFENEMAISYYKSCLESDDFPVSIVAYAILPSQANFVIASWDQATISLERFIIQANSKLSSFYASISNDAGYLFNKELSIKKISFTGDIPEFIASVHASPVNAGLCREMDEYPYSSYTDSSKRIASIDPYLRLVGRNEGTKLYLEAHRTLSKIPRIGYTKRKRSNFKRDYAYILAKYGVSKVRKIPLDIMTKIMLDLNDLGKYSFEQMIYKIFKKVDQRLLILKNIITSIVLKYRCSYDECSRKLAYNLDMEGNALIIDVIYDINKQTGYAYDFIMKLLGLEYPNMRFLIELFDRFNKKYNISYGDCIKKLEIYDQGVLNILSNAFAKV
ncbi:MAG: hypothetical protein LBF68_02275 [Christensenellaceae bacterium]|jgi:hypothetical protein|nr:hypothetical protein [Christensenellaceae bacterium]